MRMKKVFLALVTAMLTIGMTATALAAGSFSVKADELQYDLETGQGVAKGHVIVVQDGAQATADYAEFNSKDKTGTFTGNVILQKDGGQVVCQKLLLQGENSFSAVGEATVQHEGRTLQADRIDYDKVAGYATTAGGWARLIDVDGSTMDAEKIDYQLQQAVAQAYGGVKIYSEARNLQASADQVLYETKANGKLELLGNAKATQNGNSVEGERLSLLNNTVAQIEGSVKIIYLPENSQVKQETAAMA